MYMVYVVVSKLAINHLLYFFFFGAAFFLAGVAFFLAGDTFFPLTAVAFLAALDGDFLAGDLAAGAFLAGDAFLADAAFLAGDAADLAGDCGLAGELSLAGEPGAGEAVVLAAGFLAGDFLATAFFAGDATFLVGEGFFGEAFLTPPAFLAGVVAFFVVFFAVALAAIFKN